MTDKPVTAIRDDIAWVIGSGFYSGAVVTPPYDGAWDPYVEWGAALAQRSDSIISFRDDDFLDEACNVKNNLRTLRPVGGPSSQVSRERAPEQWARAEKDLQQAQTIVFLGYDFLRTDHVAKTWLINALRSNTMSGLSVRVVLGPDLSSPEIIRVLRLIRWALSDRSLLDERGVTSTTDPTNAAVVSALPMWCEDLLCLWRVELLNPFLRTR